MAQLVAKLPAGLSYAAYYFMQRQIGALRAANPTRGLKAGVTIAGLVRTHRGELSGSETFLEVGTGWSVTLPIALWLCGAYRTITVDLNRYLKSELVLEELDYIRTHQETVIELFGPQSTNPVFRERLDLLLASGTNLDRILSMINVQYIAPANAAQLQLPDESIDYHISFMVMQHIRRDLIPGILLEGSRLIKPTGCLSTIPFLVTCSRGLIIPFRRSIFFSSPRRNGKRLLAIDTCTTIDSEWMNCSNCLSGRA